MKKVNLMIAAAVAVLILSAGLTAYPLISNYINQKYASELHTAYIEAVEQTDDSLLQEAKAQAAKYNEAIAPGAYAGKSYSREMLLAAGVNYNNLLNIAGDGIMGYVDIPSININLPIYHGTGSESLDRGAGHLLGSSLPVGGASTHTVLTGHSGMAQQKVFTDLEQVELGDIFHLHILGDTLTYQVDSINVVMPYETDLLKITPGEDYCTLITCTPYGINTHRLLVRGTRISYTEDLHMIEEDTAAEEKSESKWEQQYMLGIWIGAVAAVSIITAVLIIFTINKHCRKGGKHVKR